MANVKVVVPGQKPIEFYVDPVICYLPREGETLSLTLADGERVNVVVDQVFHHIKISKATITDDDGTDPFYASGSQITINARPV